MNYYDSVNPDILDLVSGDEVRVCEFGCGAGSLAREVRNKTTVEYYVGIDICIEPLVDAKKYLDNVLHADIDNESLFISEEYLKKVPDAYFDFIIFGDVLEHLKNPDIVLRHMKRKLRDNGKILICVPNVQHWSVWGQMSMGRWPREKNGIFDKTHLRWFTLKECVILFNELGYVIDTMKPRIFNLDHGVKMADALRPLADLVGANYDEMRAGMLPYQYVFSISVVA